MKAPNDFINVSITKVFHPKQAPWNRIYAAFSDQSSANTVWRLTQNLKPDTKVIHWIPPQFYERFRAIDEAAYLLRKGPQKVKTSIRFDKADLLFKKKTQFG